MLLVLGTALDIQNATKNRGVSGPVIRVRNLEAHDRGIKGIAHNAGSMPARYVQLVFALFDDQGRQVGSSMTNLNHLDAGREWIFEAVTFERFTKYRLVEITAF